MPDPTGRWVNREQWQCPRCLWVNTSDRERCQKCQGSVRPHADEPVRPWDALDVIGRVDPDGRLADPVELAAKDRTGEHERD
jgi:hypothetical protein